MASSDAGFQAHQEGEGEGQGRDCRFSFPLFILPQTLASSRGGYEV